MDAGQLEEVVDHPHIRSTSVRICAVVARRVLGHAVLQRLGHRAQPGQRGAQVVRDPGDQLAAGGLQRRLARSRDSASRSLVRVSSADELRRARPVRRPADDELAALAEARGRPRAASGDQRTTHRAEQQREDQGDDPGDQQHDRSTTWKSWADRNIARAVPTTPASTAATATSGDHGEQPAQRRAAQQPAERRSRRGRPRRTRPTAMQDDRRSGRSRRRRGRPGPSGSRRPTPSTSRPGGSGRPRPSRAAGGRGR